MPVWSSLQVSAQDTYYSVEMDLKCAEISKDSEKVGKPEREKNDNSVAT